MRLEIDHFVAAALVLERGVQWVERHTGVRPAAGGRHEGFGTHNALAALDDRTYLEVAAIDPAQRERSRFASLVEEAGGPRLLTWCARAADLDQLGEALAARDIRFEPPIDMRRRRPDGSLLSWRLLFLEAPPPAPFFVEWRRGIHPAESAPRGISLVHWSCSLADDALAAYLREAGLPVRAAEGDGLEVALDSPRGRVTWSAP